MKIKLEYPYNKDWMHGYLVTNGEKRKTVILYNSSDERSSTSYSRYLVATSLGRYLKENEHVDHIDHDKTNDVLENLQILTPLENSRKEYLRKGRKGRVMVEIKCPVCNELFIRRKGNTQLVESKRGKVTTCSKECSARFNEKNISLNDRIALSENSIVRVFRQHE